MAKSKPTTAKKHRGLLEPYDSWTPHADCRIVLFGIEDRGVVETTSGPMVKVYLKQKVEFINYNQDVAALVGRLPVAQGYPSPELWYWNDKYWVKATDGMGEWYKEQCNLLYEIDVRAGDDYIQKLVAEHERVVAARPK